MKTKNVIKINTLLPFSEVVESESVVNRELNKSAIVQLYNKELADVIKEPVTLKDFMFDDYDFEFEVMTKECECNLITYYLQNLFQDRTIYIEEVNSGSRTNGFEVTIEMQEKTLIECFNFIENTDEEVYRGFIKSKFPLLSYNDTQENLNINGKTILNRNFFREFYNVNRNEHALEVFKVLLEYVLMFYNEKKGVNEESIKRSVEDYITGNVEVNYGLNERIIKLCKRAKKENLIKIKYHARVKNYKKYSEFEYESDENISNSRLQLGDVCISYHNLVFCKQPRVGVIIQILKGGEMVRTDNFGVKRSNTLKLATKQEIENFRPELLFELENVQTTISFLRELEDVMWNEGFFNDDCFFFIDYNDDFITFSDFYLEKRKESNKIDIGELKEIISEYKKPKILDLYVFYSTKKGMLEDENGNVEVFNIEMLNEVTFDKDFYKEYDFVRIKFLGKTVQNLIIENLIDRNVVVEHY
jgi:hypothetical protein